MHTETKEVYYLGNFDCEGKNQKHCVLCANFY